MKPTALSAFRYPLSAYSTASTGLLFMKRLFTIVAILLLVSGALWASLWGDLRAGNRYYKKRQYDNALKQYRKAEIVSPQGPVVHFNLGGALYKKGDYKEAELEYTKALSSRDPELRSMACYNLGNTALQQGNFDEAMKYYQKALELNPNNMDAKFNIEKAKQKEKEQKKINGNGQGKPSGQKTDKNQTKGNKESEQEGKNGKGKNQPSSSNNKNQQKQGMSKEDAQRILQYFNESEQNNARRRKMAQPQIPKTEEDW